jgi:mono/diheme cytochrome c family protein
MKTIAIFVVVLAAVGAGFIYSGTYNVGADEPHWPWVSKAIETLLDRSIEAHSAKVQQVPDLKDPKRIAEGAEHYSAMCTGCHLAPGMEDSEIRAGLYPQPPDLTEPNDLTPSEQFWVIKHGVKLTAMPAWGRTHEDDAIWGLVAFLQALPGMTPDAYQAATGGHGDDEGHHHPHSH